MVDVCLRATSYSTRLELAVILTTRVCQRAQQTHKLAATSAVALGRLLTGTGLIALTSKRQGTTTIQVLSKGRMGHVMVDANDQGHLRGFVKVPTLAFPLTRQERETGRRSVAASLQPGQLSVVRRNLRGEYGQSAVEMVSGEIDLDVEHYLRTSEQVPTVLACDVILENAKVALAGGVLVQAMPDGDRGALEAVRALVQGGGFLKLLSEEQDPQRLLTSIMHDAEVVEVPVIPTWRCRCSYERVIRSFQLLTPTELAEMIEKDESVTVNCDFCSTEYLVAPKDIRKVFKDLIKAEA